MTNLKNEAELTLLLHHWAGGERIDWSELSEVQASWLGNVIKIVPHVAFTVAEEAIKEYFHLACTVEYSDEEQMIGLQEAKDLTIKQLEGSQQLLDSDGRVSHYQRQRADLVTTYLSELAETTRIV